MDVRSSILLAACACSLTSCDVTDPKIDLPVATVELSTTTLTLGPGASNTITATPRASNGAILTGRAVAWSSADVAIATVTQAGVVTGVAFGTTTITATSEGASTLATVNVVPTQPTHLAASWKMDSFGSKQVPGAYRVFFDEPVGDIIVAKVEIRLDSATKTMTSGAQYQRRYCFTELHDDVPMLKYCWGDHGQFSLGALLPVPLLLTSDYIQNLFTVGVVTPDGKLTLSESLWLQEELYTTVWSRR